MKKMTVIIMSICAMIVLAACGTKVDEATAEKYITSAEGIVSLLNDGNYQGVTETFDSHMKAELTEEKLKEIEPIIEQSGDFEAIKKSSVEEKDDNYIVVLVATYSNDERIYTISFNKADEVVGLYIN